MPGSNDHLSISHSGQALPTGHPVVTAGHSGRPSPVRQSSRATRATRPSDRSPATTERVASPAGDDGQSGRARSAAARRRHRRFCRTVACTRRTRRSPDRLGAPGGLTSSGDVRPSFGSAVIELRLSHIGAWGVTKLWCSCDPALTRSSRDRAEMNGNRRRFGRAKAAARRPAVGVAESIDRVSQRLSQMVIGPTDGWVEGCGGRQVERIGC